jgi:hypothetical protein
MTELDLKPLVDNGFAIALVLGGGLFLWRSFWPWWVARDAQRLAAHDESIRGLIRVTSDCVAALASFAAALDSLNELIRSCHRTHSTPVLHTPTGGDSSLDMDTHLPPVAGT